MATLPKRNKCERSARQNSASADGALQMLQAINSMSRNSQYFIACTKVTSKNNFLLEPMGDRCVIIAFESRVDPVINERVRSLADYLVEHPIEGVIGFAPGFPYLGGLDPRLETPRRATPRTKVPAGSVAIARDQSAIYSLETPGGWNILGRTPLRMFTPETDPPSLLQPGDRVRFGAITLEQFAALQEKPR